MASVLQIIFFHSFLMIDIVINLQTEHGTHVYLYMRIGRDSENLKKLDLMWIYCSRNSIYILSASDAICNTIIVMTIPLNYSNENHYINTLWTVKIMTVP